MQRCADIMTKDPVFCSPDDMADRAADLMKRRDVGPVPVVDGKGSGKIVGILTDRDLAIKVVAEGRDAKRTRVEEVMTREVVTCHAEDDVQKAMDVMSANQVRRVPIVDRQDRLVGIVAQADVATRLHEPEKVARVVEKISQPNGTDGRF